MAEPGKITREPDFPAEIAQLFQAFNHCSDGHSPMHVMEAAANMLICAVVYHVRESGGGREQAAILAQQIGRNLQGATIKQWDREPQPTDITVHHGN